MSDTVTEVIRNVYHDTVPLEVGPDPDGLGCVRLAAVTKEAKEYYGKIELTIPPELAAALGAALIAAAKERAQ